MKLHDPALMAALLDGELKGWRRWLVRRHVARCPMCAVEYRQQMHVHRLLKDNPPRYTMNTSPDFFWSKVRGEIQERGPEEVEIAESRLSLADWLWLRPTALVTAAVTAIALVAAIGLLQVGSGIRSSMVSAHPQDTVEQVSAPTANTAATSFHSDAADATVIWISGLPWTPDMTEMKTVYASLGT